MCKLLSCAPSLSPAVLLYFISLHRLFRTVQTELQSSLTHINPGCTPQNNFPKGRNSPPHRSDTVLANASPLNSTAKWLQVCILTNCTFHGKWNRTCIYITESLCFVVRRTPPPLPRVPSWIFPHFMWNSLCWVSHKCQIRAAKFQSVAGQVQ